MSLNKQGEGKIEWTDFTWNPIQGCMHDCHWQMNDGTVAECYAKTIARKFQSNSFMRDGFEKIYWNPDRLMEPLGKKAPSKLFLDSLSDLMGKDVPEEYIHKVLAVTELADWHVFQLLTKYAPRLAQFHFPSNVWVGVSSPPDMMFGNMLTEEQKERYLRKALTALQEKAASGNITWMSFEPLSQDWARVLVEYPDAIQWAVIGAASKGSQHYAPNEKHVSNLVEVLDGWNLPVFYKGNLRSLPWARSNWRAEFPIVNKSSELSARQLTNVTPQG